MTQQTVDSHAHAVPSGLLADLAAGRVRFPHVELTPHDDSHVIAFAGGMPTRPIAAGLTDTERRAKWCADQSLDRMVIGGWVDLFGYELPSAEGADWARVLTEYLANEAAVEPHLVALGTVPLQDPEAAAIALRAQREHGLPGTMIATRAGDRELDDPAFAPFWEAAHETRAVVFLHPSFVAPTTRYSDFGLVNGLGRLEDSTVTLARLLYAGIPARYPDMRLLAAHGGGALPYVLGRLVRNHLLQPDVTADPLESFARLYFDSVVFDPSTLAFLIAKAGTDRVLLGSDYPFPIGDPAPRQIIDTVDLDGDERAALFGGTATTLFGAA